MIASVMRMLRPERGSTSSECSATATSSDSGNDMGRMLPTAPVTPEIDSSEHTFDSEDVGFPAARRARAATTTPAPAVPELREIAGKVAPVALAGDQLLPVRPDLEELFPRRGLKRGSVVGITAGDGATSLALATVAAASQQGSWSAFVGLGALGVVAASEAGIDLARCALVPDPGPTWATVVAALLDAIDLVVLAPPARVVRAADARRLSARARERGAVLLVVGAWPEGPDVRLRPLAARWTGLGDGHGALASRSLEVLAGGRGAAARERRHVVRLP